MKFPVIEIKPRSVYSEEWILTELKVALIHFPKKDDSFNYEFSVQYSVQLQNWTLIFDLTITNILLELLVWQVFCYFSTSS